MSTKVLSESALEKLVALGSPIRYENGWRSISCASYMCGSSNDSGATIELPDELDSVETLQFLGFTITAASTIWQRFVNAEEDYPARELLKFARTYVRAGNNAYDEGDDWSAALDSMGATEKLRGRILTPGHEDVRLSRTARAWMFETIEDRYLFLASLDTYIDRPELGRDRPVSSVDGGTLRTNRTVTPSHPPSRATGPPPWDKFSIPTKSNTQTTVEGPRLDENEIFLYKGSALARLNKAVTRFGNSLVGIITTSKTDFAQYPSWSFTKQPEVARKYAVYAQARNGEGEVPVGILALTMPKELLVDAIEIHGAEFREYVWVNRLSMPIPDHLKPYTKAPIIMGPIASQSTATIERVEQQGGNWTMLKAQSIGNNETATQYCVRDVQRIETMNERCRIYVTAYQPAWGK